MLALTLACDRGESKELDQSRDADFLAEAGLVEGRFESRIACSLDGSSQISHHVKTPAGVVEVVLPDDVEVPVYDSVVRVPGVRLGDGRWSASAVEVLVHPIPLINAEPREPRSIATVILHWDPVEPLTFMEVLLAMYTGDDSTNVYYNELSYGIETMAGKVFGPYLAPEPGSCDVDGLTAFAEQAMIDEGHDPSVFTQFMVHFPATLDCGFNGLAAVGSPDNPARTSWYNGTFGCTRNHELGHNYGMGHSSALACPDNPPGLFDTCQHVEYGHAYDAMGVTGGGGCGHMNVVQKTFMGWLDDCNLVQATSSGTFNLLPTEWPCNGTQALMLSAYDGRRYYLEYRNNQSEFSLGRGVLVHLAPAVMAFGPLNHVFGELGSNGDGFMRVGDSFADPTGSVSFTILEEHDSHVVVDVEYVNGAGQPSCSGGGSPIFDAGAWGSLECTAAPHPPDVTPPEVAITDPTDGASFASGASFDVLVSASDDRGVIEVELTLDGESLGALTEPPWQWPVAELADGSHEFVAVAYDSRNEASSDAVTISVGEAEETGETDTGGETGGTDETETETGGGDETETESGNETESGDETEGGPIGDETDDETSEDDSGAQTSDGCACNQGEPGLGSAWGIAMLSLLGLSCRSTARRRR